MHLNMETEHKEMLEASSFGDVKTCGASVFSSMSVHQMSTVPMDCAPCHFVLNARNQDLFVSNSSVVDGSCRTAESRVNPLIGLPVLSGRAADFAFDALKKTFRSGMRRPHSNLP
jgi:hypothetical protein